MTKKHIILAILGILFVSIAINILILSDLGLSPFDSFAFFIQDFLSIDSFGNATLLIHGVFAVILLILYIKLKKNVLLILISVITIFVSTRTINLFSFITEIEINTLTQQIILFIIGFLIYCFGVLFIAKANFIIPPYDKFVVELSELLGRDLGRMRIFMDVMLLIIAILSSFTFGVYVPFSIATFIIAFGTGFMMDVYIKLLKKINIDLE